MGNEFRVTWSIDVYADNPRQAAERAREMHNNQEESLATIYEVEEYGEYPGAFSESFTIDLGELDETRGALPTQSEWNEQR